MNILFIWISPFKNGGGVGRVTTTLAEEFERQGHNAYFLSFSKGERYVINDITQYFFPNNKSALNDDNIAYLKDFIKSKNIEVVINQGGITNPQTLKATDIARSKLGLNDELKILTVHHNCIKCLCKNFELVVKDNYKNHWLYPVIRNEIILKILKKRHKKKYQKVFNYIIEHSNTFVLLSEYYKNELDTYSVESKDRNVVGIPNPAPFEAKNVESRKEDRLLFVGRVDFQQKRADLLLEVWAWLYKKFPSWDFDIVGDGNDLLKLKEMAKKNKLERIHFHGYQDPVPYLEKAKFFVMTSAFEGFPMVLVEAQAYGVVPFVFNTFSSIYDIIEHQVNGKIIEPYNINDYTRELGSLMNDENQRKEMSKRARENVINFHPSKIAMQWEKLF